METDFAPRKVPTQSPSQCPGLLHCDYANTVVIPRSLSERNVSIVQPLRLSSLLYSLRLWIVPVIDGVARSSVVWRASESTRPELSPGQIPQLRVRYKTINLSILNGEVVR